MFNRNAFWNAGANPVTYDERRLIGRMYDDGLMPKEIVAHLPGRRSVATVLKVLKEQGVDVRRISGQRKKRAPVTLPGRRKTEDAARARAHPPGQSYVTAIPPVPLSKLMAGR